MISSLAAEDRLPHDRAVWRDYVPDPFDGALPSFTACHQVSIDFGAGQIEQGYGHSARWRGAQRWRYGWAPADNSPPSMRR